MVANCTVRWWGVPLVQVVLGGFWVVLDGLCWLRVTSDGFRWFAVLVFTSISQHTEHLTLYCTHGRTWLTEVIRFFNSKQNSKKKIIVALSPSLLKISHYFPYSAVFYVRWKTSFKGNLLNKQSQNTKQVGILQNIWDEKFWRRASEKFWKTRRLFALTVRREEMNQNGDISLSDGERRWVCRIVWCDCFNLS